ncbi:MAG: AMP-binding protein [Leptolyngbyaceae cyanobacterium bins.349]|nr:AMP-binding protein [Leptolyngbyaceae cyanobacterium bins.349]
MKNSGVKSLKRVGIVAANNTGYVEAMFNCIESGEVAVPLRSMEDQYRIDAADITQIVTPTENSAWMSRKFTHSDTNEIALISFTSGTEGSPKGVILTHRNLADVVTRLNSIMQLDDSIREYIGVPVYHSFGFGRCRAVAAAGGEFFIPNGGFNPSEIGEMLRQGKINAISAVPSLWRVLLANKDLIGSYGKRVRWIEIGSQYMSRQEKEDMKSLFPDARIVQHYGLTEASRTTLLQIHAVEEDLLESVGQALGGVDVQQTSEGQIAIRGNHVAASYLINGQEVTLQDEQGWFLTKDLGRLKNGYLYYEGRADDVINCGGIKVHPETLETKIYTRIACSNGLAVCRKPDPVRGDGFLVAITKDLNVDRQQLKEAVLQSTQELGVNAGNAIAIVDVESLPKTATGKIKRQQLSKWYIQEFIEQEQSTNVANENFKDYSPIQAIFNQVLNLRQVQPQDTFISVGGDSLSYIQFSIQLENHLGYLPKKWEHLTLQQLEELPPQQRLNSLIEMNTLLRTLAILGVVLTHAGLHLEGGSLLLLLIAGCNIARFQGCALIQGRLRAIIPSLKNILIPYFVLTAAYQIWNRKLDFGTLLLVSNFQGIEVQTSNSIFFSWFIANLIQCIILFSLPFSLQPVRNFAKFSPWLFGLAALSVGICTNRLVPYMWDTSHLYNQVPHMLFWLFALGWCVHFAKSRTARLVTTIIAAMVTPVLMGFGGLQLWWVLTGTVLLLWLPYVPVLRFVKTPVQKIAAAAYYIYLTDMIFVHFANVIGITYPVLTAAIALLGGVFTWMMIQALQQFVFHSFFKKWNYSEYLI